MKTMRKYLQKALLLLAGACVVAPGYAQVEQSIYGDAAKADVKMNYVYTLEEAFKEARQTKKPIFINFFADWAIPCHGMNKEVFSDVAFCDYMDKNFVCLWLDMKKEENESVAKRYEVKSFAHFLVLDADGNVLLRIVGGSRLPDFKESVARSLSPKTSLAGTTKTYQSGKYNKKDLCNYLEALRLAKDNSQFKRVGEEYMKMLKPKEYAAKENWAVFCSSVENRQSANYTYLVEHKQDFVKNVGAEKVDRQLEALFYYDVLSYATGEKKYDTIELLDLYNGMQKAALPDSCCTYALYRAAQLRGTSTVHELLDYLAKSANRLGVSKFYVGMSLPSLDMDEASRAEVIAYLKNSAACVQGSQSRKLSDLAFSMESRDGIKFETCTLSEALEKAAAEGKRVFVDCYTSWCVPCRKLSKEVFILPEVGGYFNHRFVSIKLDMEKGEGPDVAQRYDVNAYPTLLVLTPDGKVENKVLGYRSAKELLQLIK
jgi:thioredoxin-related protein